MHQWVLDIEVLRVVKDSDLLIAGSSGLLLGLLISIWGDWDGGEVNWRILLRITAEWGLDGGRHFDYEGAVLNA